jgi:ribonuclease HII
MVPSYFDDSVSKQHTCCDLSFERLALEEGYQKVAGIDEVGRGALFGPVCAAAVIFDINRVPAGIDDSKKLSPKQRLQLAENIREAAKDYSIAYVDSQVIDQINILEATREAMRRTISGLKKEPDYLLCDGIVITGTKIPQKNIIKGDNRSVSIAAASILAKVERDRLISCLDSIFPGYDLRSNKGYATFKHVEALKAFGPTPYHRITFRGVLCRQF